MMNDAEHMKGMERVEGIMKSMGNMMKKAGEMMKDMRGHASEGMSDKERSEKGKMAVLGKDIVEKRKAFKKVAVKAEKRYGSKEVGKRVAAAAMWKKDGKGGGGISGY